MFDFHSLKFATRMQISSQEQFFFPSFLPFIIWSWSNSHQWNVCGNNVDQPHTISLHFVTFYSVIILEVCLRSNSQNEQLHPTPQGKPSLRLRSSTMHYLILLVKASEWATNYFGKYYLDPFSFHSAMYFLEDSCIVSSSSSAWEIRMM